MNKLFILSYPPLPDGLPKAISDELGLRLAPEDASRDYAYAKRWLDGDYEGIFTDPEFIVSDVFYGLPWCAPDLFKYLSHRFPDAGFLHIPYADEKVWFENYLEAYKGRNDGPINAHAKIFGRGLDYYWAKDFVVDFNGDEEGVFLTYDIPHKYMSAYQGFDESIRYFFKPPQMKRFLALQPDDPKLLAKLKEKWPVK